VVRDPEIEELIRRQYGDKVHENHLALANVPQGARKLTAEGYAWPLVAIENVYILPASPGSSRKLGILRAHLEKAERPS
jgi:hypothetical protein